MYAESVVQERLAIAEQENGFQLEYHSPSDIDTFEAQLEKKYADEYQRARSASQGSEDPTRAFQLSINRALNNPEDPRLTAEEVRFMLNERSLVMCDAAYFLTRHYWIKPPQGIQRFSFLPGQRAQFDVIAELDAMRAAVEIIAVKARQHGISTETEGLILHRATCYYGVNAIVASADRGSTGKMSKMTFFGYDRLPWWLRPLSTRRVESDKGMLEFGGSLSAISFQHGNQEYGIARGDTTGVYHLSEVASYADPASLIEASLFKCVHPHPDVFGMLESTAEGDTGWFHDTYWTSKANWKRGRSRLCPLFLPWWLGTDKYPTPTWIRTHPIPQNWRPIKETRQMIARAKIFVQSSPVLERVVGAEWEKMPLPAHLAACGRHETGFPLAQAWYWECNFSEHLEKSKEKLWFQEMPTDDTEAFQGSYESVFGREVITASFKQRNTAYWVYGIVGQSIEDRFEPRPDEIDHTDMVIPVTYTSRITDKRYQWELVPLQWTEPFEELTDITKQDDSHKGKLFVWHQPEPGYDYSVGVDTANGIGRDDTVIVVCRRGRSAREQDVQAAEFRSNLVSHVEAYAWTMAICAYYARYMSDSTPFPEPYVAIEQIRAVGDTCQLQMSKMGYSRFHMMIRYDSKPKDMKKSRSRKRGWFTSAWSRPMLTDGFVVLVKNGWYKVNSPYTQREMTQWEVHFTSTGKDKYEHSSDATDDGIFANAMAAFCPNDLRTMAERSKNQWNSVGEDRLPPVDIGPIGAVTLNPDAGVMSTHGIDPFTR